VLGIAPARDGKVHALTIEVAERGGPPASKRGEYRVFARSGYLAPAP